MYKEFIPYEQALELKELGFDEDCLAFYILCKSENINTPLLRISKIESQKIIDAANNRFDAKYVLAPLYQQAFRWFREKYGLFPTIETNIKNLVVKKWFFSICNVNGTWQVATSHETYEEAELACLKKLIEIVKDK